MTCVVLLNEKWVHLDACMDIRLARPLAYEFIFDGTNHAVIGGHEQFDPSNVTILGNLDYHLNKKSRLLPSFRTAFNLSFEFCRLHEEGSFRKEILKTKIEEFLVSKHLHVCREIFQELGQMQQFRQLELRQREQQRASELLRLPHGKQGGVVGSKPLLSHQGYNTAMDPPTRPAVGNGRASAALLGVNASMAP